MEEWERPWISHLFLFFVKVPISARPAHSRAFRSEICGSSLASRSTQDGALQMILISRSRKGMRTEVAIFSCLAGGVQSSTCFDSLTCSELTRMMILFSASNCAQTAASIILCSLVKLSCMDS